MNPNLSTQNTGTERFINPQVGPGIRPVGMNPYTVQPRPIGMEAPRPVGRNENYYQQNPMQQNPNQLQNPQQYQRQPQQQNIMQHNQQRPPNMQQNLRFPLSEGPVRPQTNSVHGPQSNNSGHNNQRSPGAPPEGQRMQMMPQARPTGPQQQMRPPLNYGNGGISLNQANYLRMEIPRAPTQMNHPNTPQPENYKAQVPGNLTRKASDLDIKSPYTINNNQKPNETPGRPQAMGQPVPNSNERKPDLSKLQTPLPSAARSEPEEASAESDESTKADSEISDTEIPADSKINKICIKEIKSDGIKDESITSGMVQKNIKFFEENDTAKIPLTPEPIKIKKFKNVREVPDDVVKNENNKNEYESGVDETPVVHPNLGSIFQVPRKVAKIPYLKTRKSSRKLKSKQSSEELLYKKIFNQRPPFSQFLKPGHLYLPYKPGGRKVQNIKIYSSKEELLAFFENTKSWRKLTRNGSKSDQNATREKLVHKPTTNGDIPTPKKTPSKVQTPTKRNPPQSPTKTPLKSPGTPGTPGAKSLPKTPESPAPPTPLIKKVPMNKIQVGAAPSPNLKTVKSKVGSLANTTHKPGGGNVKIESHKIDLSKVQPRTEAKNEMYKPSGGEKKIQQVKLQWSAKSKIGSLENATYKPGGGDKKIESVKLDFKERAKPKVGSKDNVKHVPGGGNVKIDNQKLEFKAQSKVGSLDNVKHKPGGGDIKIFDDKTYLRQISGTSSEGRASGAQAYSDLSVVREVEGRSAPGTPGRNTSVKIRKVTTIENSGDSPKIKNITKVTVTSQTPKKEKNFEKSPTKQQVKVTYSKISSSKTEENDQLPVGIVRLPARDNAPVLKPSLSKKDVFDGPDVGKQSDEIESFSEFSKAVANKNVRITGNAKVNSVSPSLPESKSNRDDSGISKFYQDELATQEKIGEMWRERNTAEVKQNPINVRQQEGQQREQPQSFFSVNYEYGNRQFRPTNPETVIETHAIPNESRRLTFNSNLNMSSDQTSLNPTFMPSQQQRQSLNQPGSFFPP